MQSAVKPRSEGTPDGANAAASPDEHKESGETRYQDVRTKFLHEYIHQLKMNMHVHDRF